MIGLPADARLLQAFLAAPAEYLPISELSVRTGLPETRVRERLSVLSEAGYEFEVHPLRGYRLARRPDRLIGDEILARLPSPRWVREILVFAETQSTNDIIHRLGRDGAAEGIVAFAEHQTGGRGRFGRKWDSKRGEGLWFSLLARPAMPMAQWARLTLATALAVADGIVRSTGLEAGIKWPNDVLVLGKKVSGILVENRGFLTIGIGVNANQTEFSPELSHRASSLRLLSGAPVDRAELAAAILHAFGERYRQACEDFGGTLADYRARCVLLGEYVRMSTADGMVYSGVAEEVDDEGRLGLRQSSGELRWFTDGEASLSGF